jgi:cell division septum initiation protein DivIVA
MGILELIDKLEDLIAQGARVPLVDKVLVSTEDLLHILDEMRLAVPEEIKEAQRVLREKDRLLAAAQKEAAQAVADAEAALNARITESDLVRRAEERAKQVLEEAQTKARAILAEADSQTLAVKLGADEYARDVLYRLEAQLTGFLNTVRKGIESLEGEKGEAEHGV